MAIAKDVQEQAEDLVVSELVSVAWAFADIMPVPLSKRSEQCE